MVSRAMVQGFFLSMLCGCNLVWSFT